MTDESRELLSEVFDISRVKGATAKWPKARKEPPIERTHPDIISERKSGPFEPLEGWNPDEEIGYEGER